MSAEEKVAWIRANGDRFGLDFSNVENIDLEFADQYVQGWDGYGRPITCDPGSCAKNIPGAYKDGTISLYRGAFEGGESVIYRDIQVSKGFVQGANELSVDYTPMEQFVHTMGHEEDNRGQTTFSEVRRLS